ncbi:hypothetical protein EDEG_00478 [Edhazardia aedis USNM 41457]|uniref:Uncharacterized protein n=1 Tax=Edhazardia aedis (strain USNM 41457) TaxID=1003232 RepID=J9DFF6_EDHAE|nr:hypothetical protein EDEG_00478 [Edhazardia aedis USNM 41457]|eukprot:EJW01335.1 hypothetical protein EDEG_00478 [Edhazardia aedis USNM 41457]
MKNNVSDEEKTSNIFHDANKIKQRGVKRNFAAENKEKTTRPQVEANNTAKNAEKQKIIKKFKRNKYERVDALKTRPQNKSKEKNKKFNEPDKKNIQITIEGSIQNKNSFNRKNFTKSHPQKHQNRNSELKLINSNDHQDKRLSSHDVEKYSKKEHNSNLQSDKKDQENHDAKRNKPNMEEKIPQEQNKSIIQSTETDCKDNHPSINLSYVNNLKTKKSGEQSDLKSIVKNISDYKDLFSSDEIQESSDDDIKLIILHEKVSYAHDGTKNPQIVIRLFKNQDNLISHCKGKKYKYKIVISREIFIEDCLKYIKKMYFLNGKNKIQEIKDVDRKIENQINVDDLSEALENKGNTSKCIKEPIFKFNVIYAEKLKNLDADIQFDEQIIDFSQIVKIQETYDMDGYKLFVLHKTPEPKIESNDSSDSVQNLDKENLISIIEKKYAGCFSNSLYDGLDQYQKCEVILTYEVFNNKSWSKKIQNFEFMKNSDWLKKNRIRTDDNLFSLQIFLQAHFPENMYEIKESIVYYQEDFSKTDINNENEEGIISDDVLMPLDDIDEEKDEKTLEIDCDLEKSHSLPIINNKYNDLLFDRLFYINEARPNYFKIFYNDQFDSEGLNLENPQSYKDLLHSVNQNIPCKHNGLAPITSTFSDIKTSKKIVNDICEEKSENLGENPLDAIKTKKYMDFIPDFKGEIEKYFLQKCEYLHKNIDEITISNEAFDYLQILFNKTLEIIKDDLEKIFIQPKESNQIKLSHMTNLNFCLLQHPCYNHFFDENIVYDFNEIYLNHKDVINGQIILRNISEKMLKKSLEDNKSTNEEVDIITSNHSYLSNEIEKDEFSNKNTYEKGDKTIDKKDMNTNNISNIDSGNKDFDLKSFITNFIAHSLYDTNILFENENNTSKIEIENTQKSNDCNISNNERITDLNNDIKKDG